jgi:hypothetical protein
MDINIIQIKTIVGPNYLQCFHEGITHMDIITIIRIQIKIIVSSNYLQYFHEDITDMDVITIVCENVRNINIITIKTRIMWIKILILHNMLRNRIN